MTRPDLTQVPSFYHGYINLVKEDDLFSAFRMQEPVIKEFLLVIPEQKHLYRYAPGKWTVKEILQHMIDAERIFSYRALCFARKDPYPIPGFDEKDYVSASFANEKKWMQMVNELIAVRKSTELLYSSFNDEQLKSSGIANNSSNYVLGWGFIAIGHLAHHLHIIQQRYMN
ncbi:MAG: DinB family protein [Chitinophagaceae bacterium]|jgi:hypothetical protein|nr:DinB family protein [Chitinophagaceae bacterium]